MNQNKAKQVRRQIRHARVRSVVSGTLDRPRLSVFRANQHIYAQLIDDATGKTLVQASSAELKKAGQKTAVSSEVGKKIAEKALALNIKAVVFDRGGYAYHGRVKALAEGAREAGLQF